jgi:hypothetical protein
MAPQADSFGVEIHSDVWGPLPVQSIGGCNYYVTFTDDYSHYMHVKLLHTKDKAFAAWASTQHGANIKHFRSDHSGEFTSQAFNAFLKEQGTKCINLLCMICLSIMAWLSHLIVALWNMSMYCFIAAGCQSFFGEKLFILLCG